MQGFGGDYNAGRLWMAGVLPSGVEKQIPRYARNDKGKRVASLTLGMTTLAASALRSVRQGCPYCKGYANLTVLE